MSVQMLFVPLIGQLSNPRGVPEATGRGSWPLRGVSGGRLPGCHDERVTGEAGSANPLVPRVGFEPTLDGV
jgi:hypothetical protein